MSDKDRIKPPKEEATVAKKEDEEEAADTDTEKDPSCPFSDDEIKRIEALLGEQFELQLTFPYCVCQSVSPLRQKVCPLQLLAHILLPQEEHTNVPASPALGLLRRAASSRRYTSFPISFNTFPSMKQN